MRDAVLRETEAATLRGRDFSELEGVHEVEDDGDESFSFFSFF
jgi:hypothetical protein